MLGHDDLREINRKATARRRDLLQQMGLPEEELNKWCVGEAGIILEAFQMALDQDGFALAVKPEDAEPFTRTLMSTLAAAFDTGFEVGAALGLEKAGR